jgi:uncharacterized LabA/DUF88 family protein
MNGCLLVLNWNDVVTSLAKADITLNPLLIGRALLKQVGLRSRLEQSHAIGDWSGPEGAAAGAMLQRLGFVTHSLASGASAMTVDQTIAAILRSAPGFDELLLVAGPGSARALIEMVTGSERRMTLWHPRASEEALASVPPHVLTQDLVRVLHLDTATTTGIFVDWPHIEASLKDLNVCVEPEALAEDLLRCASLLGEVTVARAYGPFQDPFPHVNGNSRAGSRALQAFGRYYEISAASAAGQGEGAGEIHADVLRHLSAPWAPDTWIFVSDNASVGILAEAIHQARRRAVLWAVDTPELSLAMKTLVDHYVPLQWVLDLRPHTVGLFVDYENVARSLAKQAYFVDPATLARGLGERARAVGQIIDARAYADWDQFLEVREPDGRVVRRGAQRAFREANIDTVYVLPGPNSSDVQLARDVEILLNSPDCPDQLIIASGDGDFCGTIDGIRRRGKEVTVWSVRTATRAELSERANRHEWIEDFLNLNAVERPGRAAPALPISMPLLPEEPMPPPFDRPIPRGGAGAYGVSVDTASQSRMCSWVRLGFYLERTLRENHWNKIAFKRLAALLAEREEFGPTPANAMMWLNRAKAEALLLTEQEAHRADPTIKVTTCRLNREHPLGRAAVEVPDRTMRLLFQMLQKMPWVSFKLLRSVLMREQWLGGAPHHLDEQAIDEWINFLVQDGAILMAKEPNAENPDFPVTALRLNADHVLAKFIVQEAMEGTRLAAERAILAVDHFTIRTHKPWMAMSALRRSLDSLGRDELQEVLQGLQNLGALVTASYPNPQKDHSTTGCYLNADDPLVQDAVNTRNAIIRATQYMLRYRSWVPLSKLDEELTAQMWTGTPQSTRLAWFLLLRDEGILELDHDGIAPQNAWGSIQCRLNVADAVVRMVVAEQPAPIS